MDIKKRPLEDDQEMGIAKKRAMASITGSPIPVNGKMDGGREHLNIDNLESFRKEAIFRRMKHYSRENERAQDKVTELEKCCSALEANVATIGACWEQLVQEVRLLVKPECLPASEGLTDEEMFDLASDPHSSAYLFESLRDRGRNTQELIAAFIHLGPNAPTPDGNQLRQQCSNLQSQVSALRAELLLANARAVKAESDKDRYHASLVAAEACVDRAETASAQAMRAPSTAPEKEENTPIVKEEVKEEVREEVKEEVKEEEEEVKLSHLSSPAIPDDGPLMNGQNSQSISEEQQDWKALYENCDKRNRDLSEEVLQLKTRCSELVLEVTAPGIETIQKLPLYEALMQRLQYFKSDAESHKQKYSELEPQVNHLRELQEDFKEKLIADYNVRYDEQKSLIVKRDNENVRLREQRDGFQAEVNELKSRLAEKKSTAQLQILLQSRAERIAAFEIESKRLKSSLAANAGQGDVLELLLGDKLRELPERLRNAERRIDALQASLAALDSSYPDVAQHIRSESEAKEALAVALVRLEGFDSMFGPGSPLPPDQQAMARQLREKDELLRVANLQHRQEQVASNDLFSEIERLSAAWDMLDRQNKTKVFEMDAMDAKLQRMAGEKAKADNKYFGAMRQKEAAEAERKAIARTVEKLQKAVERFNEAEKGFAAKLTSQTREINLHKTRCQTFEDHLDASERQVKEQQLHHEQDQKQLGEMKRQLLEALAKEKQQRAEARRLEEDSIRARKEADRQAAKANAVSSGNVTTREMDLEQKYEKCMKLLRCSTCKQGLRSHVLTKCMHSFCKDCIQARIDTRQRKCPACNMGFSQSEFQQLYFQ